MTVEEVVARLRAAGCVFAEAEAELLLAQAESGEQLAFLVGQRVTGIPLEHVLGWVEFYGDRYAIGPGVFVPRPRSITLVHEAVALAEFGATIVDLCCGCGAIGAAIARRVSGSRLFATDNDPVATAWARLNVAELGGEVVTADLYAGLPPTLRGTVDLITIVAPYVPTAEIALLPHEARDFEPLAALDGGPDGLGILARAIAEAREWLSPQGCLVTEIAESQTQRVHSLAARAGLAARISTDDDGGTVAVLTIPDDGTLA